MRERNAEFSVVGFVGGFGNDHRIHDVLRARRRAVPHCLAPSSPGLRSGPLEYMRRYGIFLIIYVRTFIRKPAAIMPTLASRGTTLDAQGTG